MRFLAFYRLIDKISSFLPFRFPPFSHFFRRLTHYSQKYSLSLSLSQHTQKVPLTHGFIVTTYSLNFSYFHSFKPLVCLSTCLFKNLEWPTVQQYVLSFIVTVNINQKYLHTNRFCVEGHAALCIFLRKYIAHICFNWLLNIKKKTIFSYDKNKENA